MYERGVLIMYGNSGVCRVEDVAPMKGSRGAEKKPALLQTFTSLWQRHDLCPRRHENFYAPSTQPP